MKKGALKMTFIRGLAGILTAASISAAQFSQADASDIYIYRYKFSPYGQSQNSGPNVNQDIKATFIGSVGQDDFLETIPVKHEWETAVWQITSGSLPSGVVYDSITRTFSGVPASVSNTTLSLVGIDNNGKQVGSASVSLQILDLPDQVVDIEAYGHVGQHFSMPFDLPKGITVDGLPKLITALPDGTSFNGRYFQGVPAKPGRYPIIAVGYDFLGKASVAFKGYLKVTDGPEFPFIKDDLRPLSALNSIKPNHAWWLNEPLPQALRSISGKPNSIRYLLETDPLLPLPGSLTVTGSATSPLFNGGTGNYYDQGRVRIKATDTDGTTSFSNWFKIGSSGSAFICVPYLQQSVNLPGIVGMPFSYTVPSGNDASARKYSLLAGALPENVNLDPETGIISGTPTTKQSISGVLINIDFPDKQAASAITCGPYDFQIKPNTFTLDTTPFDREFRVGKSFSTTLNASGTLHQGWSISLSNDHSYPPQVSFNEVNHVLSGGPVTSAGTFTGKFTLNNGDGDSISRNVTFTARAPLKINDVPKEVSIARYDTNDNLMSVSYEPNNIVYPGSESVSVENGPFPPGITFNAQTLTLYGGSTAPVGKYGPFRFRLSDSTKEIALTNEFFIKITEREPLLAGATTPPVFHANQQSSAQPFSVTQAPLAKGVHGLTHALEGPSLPTGLIFDETSGVISGRPLTETEVGPYHIAVTEQSPDQLSARSESFNVKVAAPLPIPEVTLPVLEGNALDLQGQYMVPSISSADPYPSLQAVKQFLVGEGNIVKFKTISAVPPGLTFNPLTGTISGTPSAPFSEKLVLIYEDAAGREGRLNLPVAIHSYPEIGANLPDYSLPRLSDATQLPILINSLNDGFWQGASWSLDPSSDPLPKNLSLLQSNQSVAIVGNTTESIGEVFNLKIKAVSKADPMIWATTSLTLTITPRQTLELKIPQTTLKFEMDELVQNVVARQTFSPNPSPVGSYVAPLRFSLPDAPSWMSISSTGQIIGTPKALGDYPFTIRVTDAEGATADAKATIRATLAGFVAMSPGAQSIQVRRGEFFRIPDSRTQIISNVVRPIKSFSNDLNAPTGVVLDPQTGVQQGLIDAAGIFSWKAQVVDAHDRRLANGGATFTVSSTDRLSVPPASSVVNGKQYDQNRPIFIAFQRAKNILGSATYAVEGDIPGHLYYKFYTDNDPTKLAYFLDSQSGSNVNQAPGEPIADTQKRLSPDHIVFDTLSLTLSGIPSRSGSFSLRLFASDDYAETGYAAAGQSIGKVEYNEAFSDPVKLIVEPAASLSATANVVNETLQAFTSQPTLEYQIHNSAFGLPVKWEPLPETLPKGITAKTANESISYDGYPEVQGSFQVGKWIGRDAANRTVALPTANWTIGSRATLELISNKTLPRLLIAGQTQTSMTVSAKNLAYGALIGKASWKINGAGNLPQGVSYKVTDDGVTFEGIATVKGEYLGVTVTGTDQLGATATISIPFNVVTSSESIVLNTFAITTKVNFPLEMRPPYSTSPISTDNTYGQLRFHSDDLPQASGISLSASDGKISGKVTSPRKVDFNLWVTDETDRLTSKPVSITVLPNLRVLAPERMTFEQGTTARQSVSTDYVLGKVTYEIGGGTWPKGFVVNPQTGEITSSFIDPVTGLKTTDVIAEARTYSGLSILAHDEFDGLKDTASSNPFTIIVTPTQAQPDIADQPKTILGVASQSITAWYPRPASGSTSGVVEKVNRKAWNYGGTIYSSNYDLTQYGLLLDPVTGSITGTPNKPFIIRDFVLKVTAQNGETDSTLPFWIGVAPKDPMKLSTSFKTNFSLRKGASLSTPSLQWDNALGQLSHTKTSGNGAILVDTATGKLLEANATSSWALGNYPVAIKVLDEFSRTADATLNLSVHEALTMDASPKMLPFNASLKDFELFRINGNIGTVTAQVSGLPNFMQFSAPNLISGTIPASEDGKQFNVNVTIIDNADQASVTGTVLLKIGKGYLYFRILDPSPNRYGTASAGFLGTTFREGSVDITSLLIPGKLPNKALDSQPYAFSGNYPDALHVGPDENGQFWKAYRFSRPVQISSVTVNYYAAWQSYSTNFLNPQFQASNDGVNWTTIWKQSPQWPISTTNSSTKP